VKSAVRAMTVVVSDVFSQDSTQVVLAEDEQMIEHSRRTLAIHRSE